jgi:hypothetical protein
MMSSVDGRMCLGMVELLTTVAEHPALTIAQALPVLELLGKSYQYDLIYSGAAKTALDCLVKRFLTD